MKKRAPPPRASDNAVGGGLNEGNPSVEKKMKEAVVEAVTQIKSEDQQPIDIPERVGGMLSADILKMQKRGLIQRLNEQKRKLAELEVQASNLAKDKEVWQSTVSSVTHAWSELDEHLQSLLVDGTVAQSLQRATTQLADLSRQDSALHKLLSAISYAPSTDLQPADVTKELEVRAQKSRQLLQAVASAMHERRGSGGDSEVAAQLETLTARYSHLSKEFEAASQKLHVLEAARSELESKVASLDQDRQSAQREADRLREQVDSLTELSKSHEGLTATSAPVAAAAPAALVKSEGASAAAVAATSSDPKHEELSQEFQLRIKALERTVEMLKDENINVAKDRDRFAQTSALNNPRLIPDDLIRISPAFLSLQAQVHYYQKEHVTSQSSVASLTLELNSTVDVQKAEREKFRVWRKDWERSSRDAIGALKKELSMVRKERDDYRSRLDSIHGPTNKEKVQAEVQKMLQTHQTKLSVLDAQMRRLGEEKDAALLKLARYEGASGEEGGLEIMQLRQTLKETQTELDLLKTHMAVEKGTQEVLRSELKAAEEKAREMSVVLGVWKKSGGEKRDINEVRESEALLKARIDQLTGRIAELERGGAGAGSGAPAAASSSVAEAEAAAKESVKARYETELRKILADYRTELTRREEAERVRDLQQKELSDKRAEVDALMGEMGHIVNAFEDLQKQNERLLEDLGRKDDTHSQLVQQRANARQIEMLLREEKNQLMLKMSNLKKLTQAQKTQLTTQTEAIEAQDNLIARLREENQLASSLLDQEKLMLKEAQKGLQDLKSKYDEASNSLKEAQRRWDDAQRDHRSTHLRCIEMEAELQIYKGTKRPLSSGEIVEEQLRQLRVGACCSVCNDRYKNTVLTTCFHVFCRDCVNSLIKDRNRKCPRCGKVFDKVDAKTVYLDFEGE